MKASHNRTERSSVSLNNDRAPCRSAIATQSHTMTGGILKIGSEGRATRTSGERKREISRGAGTAQARAGKEKACRRSPLPAGLVTPLPRILRHLSRSTCAVERKTRLTLTEACRGGTAARHAPCSVSRAPSRLATGRPRDGVRSHEASGAAQASARQGHPQRPLHAAKSTGIFLPDAEYVARRRRADCGNAAIGGRACRRLCRYRPA